MEKVPTVERIDIERALDDIVSNEEGMRFQNLAVVLAKQRWPELIACERHNDLGLDAYAWPVLSNGIGKGLACSTSGEFGKLNRDANTAKEHYSALSVLMFATLARVTQDRKDQWRDKILSTHGLELVVLSREDVITELQLPANASLCRAHLKLDVPYETPGGDLLDHAREAATTMAAEWARRLAGQPQITLDLLALDERGNESGERFPTTELRALLLRGRRLILEAPAGRGKTTTLVQVAQGTSGGGIPILVDLPAWITSGQDILDYIALRRAFRSRGISADDLDRLGRAEQLLFLLNGWNEVADGQADGARTMLAELEREFPAAGIVVATRAHHILPPLPGAARLQLLPVTPQQRLQYLRHALPTERARELHTKLISDSALDDLTRTPFILAAVTNLARSYRDIPRTKLGVLAAFVALTEELEHHHGPLQGPPLMGRAAAYLSAFALALTGRGDVLLGEPEARAICSSVSDQLRTAGQIAVPPEPSLILASLSKHHLLEHISYSNTTLRFEHQQFQEYYAAAALRDELVAVIASNDPSQRHAFNRSYLNVPAWEEPLEMLAEDVGEGDQDVALGRALVEGALPIDPIFASRLARLSGARVWAEVRVALHNRLRSLYGSSDAYDQECAVAAMLATGSEEFADVIVPRLTGTDHHVRHATYRAGPDFFPSSVGMHWQTVVAAWPEQQRIEFLSQLTIGREHLEVASTLARTDPSAAVRVEAIRLLAWMRERDEVA